MIKTMNSKKTEKQKNNQLKYSAPLTYLPTGRFLSLRKKSEASSPRVLGLFIADIYFTKCKEGRSSLSFFSSESDCFEANWGCGL